MIPLLMATQHPDSTKKVSVNEELWEAINDLTPIEKGGFGCDEKMIDYEGKLTPYHQMKWIINEMGAQGFIPGEDFLITPRIPKMDLEDPDRHLLSIMAAVSANIFSMRWGGQAIEYIILPMADLKSFSSFTNRLNKLKNVISSEFNIPNDIKPIPLIETTKEHLNIDVYLKMFLESNTCPRIFLGKSDASLESGHIASVITIKFALNRIQESDCNVMPILGMGKPPFRGHLSEWNISNWVRIYAGYKTVTIQSALRFDTDRAEYIKTIRQIKANLDLKQNFDISALDFLEDLSSSWKYGINELSEIILRMSKNIPNMRARIESYGRRISGYKLPRAIKFTASLYSLGIGPTILELYFLYKRGKKSLIDRVLELIPEIYYDWKFDAFWTSINHANTNLKLKKEILKEIFYDLNFESNNEEDFIEALDKISYGFHQNHDVSEDIIFLAKKRKFLG